MLKILAQGLKSLDLDLSTTQQQQMLEYLELLYAWNKTHNLTAIRNIEQMVSYHLLDSLSILKLLSLNNKPVLDLGSGAGLPGIPLAICNTKQNFVLLDSNIKKIIFLNKVIAALKLNNITTAHHRAEQYQPAKLFSCIVVRACANTNSLIKLASPLLATNGRILAMKGPNISCELIDLDPDFVANIKKITVPGINKERFVAIITRKDL